MPVIRRGNHRIWLDDGSAKEILMASRLWTNPPLKPDGSMDYSQLSVSEICEDLTESLMDRIENNKTRSKFFGIRIHN